MVLDRILGFIIRIIARGILDLIPKRVRKFTGWSLLGFGAVAILWSMYADPGPPGLGSGFLNLIAGFIGIISAFFGLVFLLRNSWDASFSDEAIADDYAEYEESLLRLREDGFIDSSGDTENENELVDHSESESGQGGALKLVIGISAGLIVLLSLAIAGLWIISQAANITIGGPTSALLTWENEYRDLTGLDSVQGDGTGVVLCIVDSGIDMGHPTVHIEKNHNIR